MLLSRLRAGLGARSARRRVMHAAFDHGQAIDDLLHGAVDGFK